MYSDDTGFIMAAKKGHLNVLEFLLTKGSSVNEKNDMGMIHLYLSIYLPIYLSIYWQMEMIYL